MINIILLSGAQHLHKYLETEFYKSNIDANVYSVELKFFPDSEQYIRIPIEKGIPNYVIQSMFDNPDKKFVETILALYTLKDLGAKNLVCFFTYLAYARQDRRIKEGEAISQSIIVKTLFNSGIEKAFVFDVHIRGESEIISKFNIINLSCVNLFADYFRRFKNREDFVVISPDEGSFDIAKRLANELNLIAGYTKKKRLDGSHVKISDISVDVKSKNVIIIDDIISTGNTMLETIDLLKERGVKDIYVSATHGLFVNDALKKLKEANIKDLVTTNTVLNEFAKLDVSKIIVKEIVNNEN